MTELSHQARIEQLENELRSVAVAIAKGTVCKLHAIKAWRCATGATLADSKSYIESLGREATETVSLADRLNLLERRVSALEPKGITP